MLRTLLHTVRSAALPLRVAGLLLLLLAAGGRREAAAQAQPTLQPGDTVRVAVWNRTELSGSFAVAGDGTLAHPLYSEIVVAGVPLATVRQRIVEVASRYQSTPQVVVEPLMRVSVTGEARRPGLFALPPETTVAQAVALAGGGTEWALLRRARLTRGGTETEVDLSRPGFGAAQDRIRSGDLIFIPRRRPGVFREYVVPASSVAAALGTLVAIIINTSNR